MEIEKTLHMPHCTGYSSSGRVPMYYMWSNNDYNLVKRNLKLPLRGHKNLKINNYYK